MASSGLTNKCILVTRAEKHYPALSRMVALHGGIAVSLPCLAVEAMPQSIAKGLTRLDDFSDILFTSANGVHAVAQLVNREGSSLNKAMRGKRVAAVGKKTAAVLSELGIQVDMIPAKASQDGLIEAYAEHGLPTGLLFFRAEEGRETLAKALMQQGVEVEIVAAYRTVCPTDDASEIIAKLQHHDIDAVLLGSAKTAAHYLQRVGALDLANRPVIVAISENMAVSARALGLRVQVVAKVASFEAMLDALAEYFDSGSL